MNNRGDCNGSFRGIVSRIVVALSFCFTLPALTEIAGGSEVEKIDPADFQLN
jgi:hypothetical protein